MNKKYILVTGCAGFVGSNFVNFFHKKNKEYVIVGVDNLSTGKIESVAANILFYKIDIKDHKKIEQVFVKYKPEYVFHFAAIPGVVACEKDPFGSTDINICGTVNLLELAVKYSIKRFIFSSSASVYGQTDKVPVGEDTNTPNPQGIYAAQKIACEFLCSAYSSRYAIETVCLRYFNIYGPGQRGGTAYASVIPGWLETTMNSKKRPFIEGNGENTRDFCYVEDIANANYLAMKSKFRFTGEAINIGSGKETSIVTIRKMIDKYLDQPLNLEQRPERPKDIRRSVAKTSRSKKMLGFQAETNLETGIKKTVNWFKEIFPSQN